MISSEPLVLRLIGTGLAEWSGIEYELYMLFQMLCCMPPPTTRYYGATNAALDAVVSLDAKMKAIQAAANVTLRGRALLYVTTKALARVGKLSKRRNEIAHFGLVTEADSVTSYIEPYLAIAPNKSRKRLYASDLMILISDLQAGNALMRWLNRKVGEELGLLPIFHEPIPDLALRILPHTEMTDDRP